MSRLGSVAPQEGQEAALGSAPPDTRLSNSFAHFTQRYS